MEGAIAFAAMDIFNSEALYNELFEFKETGPLTEQFNNFKIDSKVFLVNSGPFMIYQVLIVTGTMSRRFLNFMCTIGCNPRWRLFRWIGRQTYVENNEAIISGTQRLFLESFFDITFCAFLNIMAFYQAKTLQGFYEFFATA